MEKCLRNTSLAAEADRGIRGSDFLREHPQGKKEGNRTGRGRCSELETSLRLVPRSHKSGGELVLPRGRLPSALHATQLLATGCPHGGVGELPGATLAKGSRSG